MGSNRTVFIVDDAEKRMRNMAAHLSKTWPGRQLTWHRWELGPMSVEHPQFGIWVVSPADQSDPWCLVTCGSPTAPGGFPQEFLLTAPSFNDTLIELLTALAYAQIEYPLHLGRARRIGRPWFPKSAHTALYNSLPYADGPDFEHVVLAAVLTHIRWMVPVTEAEYMLVHQHGGEVFEELLETFGGNPVDPTRPCVTQLAAAAARNSTEGYHEH